MTDNLDDLIKAADPLLTKEAQDKEKAKLKLDGIDSKLEIVDSKLEIIITLLDRLCALKEEQQQKDNNFRDLWWTSKIKDSRVALWVLGISNISLALAAAAFYIDANGSAEELVLMLKYMVS